MNKVQMAAKLYECRDTARQLLGDQFGTKMEEFGATIKAVAEREGLQLIPAATQLANQTTGFTCILILAALVELIEPSSQTQGEAA